MPPYPLPKEVQAEFDYFNDVVRDPDSNLPIIDPNSGKPVVAGMRALWETGASYVDSYHLTSGAYCLFLHPGSAAETWATRGAKLALYLQSSKHWPIARLGAGHSRNYWCRRSWRWPSLAEKLKKPVKRN